jgi:hypothetical protein
MVTRGEEIFVYQLEDLGETIKEAIRNHDIIFLRGIQAMESTIWNKVRGAESVISTIITNAYDSIDSTDPSKDKASKIKTVVMDKVRKDWQGISKENIIDAITELENLGLAKIEIMDDSDKYGNPVELLHAVYLTPIWDDIIQEMIAGSEDSFIFASSIGKLIGLSIAGRKPNARGIHTYGLGSWKPIARTCLKAADKPDGRLLKEEMKMIFIESAHYGTRRYYELRQRDKAKSKEIRFIVDDAGDYITINRDAILAYERIRDRSMERLR